MTDVVWLIILMQLLELALNCYWMAQGALAIVLVPVSGKMNGYHVTSDSDTLQRTRNFATPPPYQKICRPCRSNGISSGFIGTNQEYHTEHKLYHPELMNQVKAHQKKAVPLIDYTSTCLFRLKLRTGQI